MIVPGYWAGKGALSLTWGLPLGRIHRKTRSGSMALNHSLHSSVTCRQSGVEELV